MRKDGEMAHLNLIKLSNWQFPGGGPYLVVSCHHIFCTNDFRFNIHVGLYMNTSQMHVILGRTNKKNSYTQIDREYET